MFKVLYTDTVSLSTKYLHILKSFLFCDAPWAVAAITFKLMLCKYLTACQNMGIIWEAGIPSVANVAKLYDNGLTTLLIKNTNVISDYK